MDDNNNISDEQPSTSKKYHKSSRGDNDKRKDERDEQMDSDTSATTTVSYHSKVETDNMQMHAPKQLMGNKSSKVQQSKRKGKGPGRVNKRPPLRRLGIKTPKRKLYRRRRPQSNSSTIFTRLSSGTLPSLTCVHCGHRCCRRRYETRRMNRPRKARKPRSRNLKYSAAQTKWSQCLQVGSKCQMLSALCVNTNATPTTEQNMDDTMQHSEVTPEMIYATLRCLCMWRQEVPTIAIMEYIKRSYPVCQDIPMLCEELLDKLHVACLIGIITCPKPGCWSLSSALQQLRRLTKRHVTIFWDTYADTMRPISKKALLPDPNRKPEERQTNTKLAAANVNNTNDII